MMTHGYDGYYDMLFDEFVYRFYYNLFSISSMQAREVGGCPNALKLHFMIFFNVNSMVNVVIMLFLNAFIYFNFVDLVFLACILG